MLKSASLKSQDVLVACKLFILSEGGKARDWTFASMGDELELSTSTVHEAFERCRLAKVIIKSRDIESVSKKHFHDLLVFAVPTIFYVVRGPVVTGTPTGLFAPSLLNKFPSESRGVLPVVWEGREGSVSGESIAPLYPTVPKVAKDDPALYELLALVDVLRTADARCRNLAATMLEKRILKGET